MFFISMKAGVGARTDDTDAIESFSMQVLGLRRLKGVLVSVYAAAVAAALSLRRMLNQRMML
jgi:hypothetical protein